MKEYIKQSIITSIELKKTILNDETLLFGIEKAASVLVNAYQKGNKILIAGNGGSAADSQHIAAELVSRFEFDRPGLPALALSTDTSMLTAIGNDYGYEYLFARQLQAQSKVGDVFMGISTSGNSPNIVKAIDLAKTIDVITISLSGQMGRINEMADISLSVPSVSTPRIQESHILIGHIICGIIEKNIFGS